MAAELGIRMKSPPHVGGFVKHEIWHIWNSL